MDKYRHTLQTEFPEYKQAIHKLKLNDSHFARLFDEYDKLDQEIHRIETGAAPDSDEYTEELKKKRLDHKDQLFHILKAADQPS